ncbi:hypothetical protein D3C78_1101770 [compost metagenome]
MLEIGTVEAPGGQHHHAGLLDFAGLAQGVEQQVRIVVDGGDALLGEQLGEQAHHHLAVLQHVGDAAGRAQVVLQHVVAAAAIAHQIDPGDVRVDVARHVQALHRQLVLVVGQHLLRRDQPGLEDALVVVEVGEEQVQRLHPLDAAGLDGAPLAGRDTAGDGVEGDQALGALVVAVEGEGDPGPVEQQVGFPPALVQLLRRRLRQPAGELAVVGSAAATGVMHLVIENPRHAVLLAAALFRGKRSSARPAPGNKSFFFNDLEIGSDCRAPPRCTPTQPPAAAASFWAFPASWRPCQPMGPRLRCKCVPGR